MTDRRTLVDMLGATPLFSGLSRKELETILTTAREVDHPAGRAVVAEGSEGVGFHLILAGSATVTQRDRRLRTLGPGDSFGDIALIDGGARSATVTADTPLRTLSLASWEFKPLLETNAQIAYKLLVELCRRLREAEERVPV